MSKPQALAMFMIGAVAVAAFFHSRRLAQQLQAGGILYQPAGTVTI